MLYISLSTSLSRFFVAILKSYGVVVSACSCLLYPPSVKTIAILYSSQEMQVFVIEYAFASVDCIFSESSFDCHLYVVFEESIQFCKNQHFC